MLLNFHPNLNLTFPEHMTTRIWYFLGAIFRNGQSTWLDGTNWNPWNSTYFAQHNKNFLKMNKNDDNGRWRETDGRTSYQYICKMPSKNKDRIYISRGKDKNQKYVFRLKK